MGAKVINITDILYPEVDYDQCLAELQNPETCQLFAGKLVEYLTFRKHPDQWPFWPLLPVQRLTQDEGRIELGVIWQHHPTAVRLGNIVDLMVAKAFFDADAIIYGSINEMVQAGWVID